MKLNEKLSPSIGECYEATTMSRVRIGIQSTTPRA